ncbi:MAG: helix-turn-helix transcriptional regulator [Ruminococcaceae bacterium]|nr:helix-turn-helix transcriptional regulator [Oscillospiraceae bacterium]
MKKKGDDSLNQEKIGKFIAQCRKAKNLTQSQLAEMLGISTNAVSKWERGLSMMDISLLKPLSEILGVSVNDILSGEIVEDNMLKEKSEENIINVSKMYHLKGIESGAWAMLLMGGVLIVASLMKGVNPYGFMSMLMSFSAAVSYKKYKLLGDRNQLFYVVCYSLCAALGAINYIIYIL